MLKYNEPGHVCPRTNRKCVTIEGYDKILRESGDLWAYQYSPTAELMGLDPWRLIEGVIGCLNKERGWILCYASGHETTVPSDFTVYV